MQGKTKKWVKMWYRKTPFEKIKIKHSISREITSSLQIAEVVIQLIGKEYLFCSQIIKKLCRKCCMY